MKLGKRTARLIREAMVMGFVQGSMWGEFNPRSHRNDSESKFPLDSDIVARTLRGAQSFSDIYPLLSRVEAEPPYLAPSPKASERSDPEGEG